MKRFIGIVVSTIAAVSCMSVFAGCAGKEASEVSLVFDIQAIPNTFYNVHDEGVLDRDNKYFKYVFEGEYGNAFSADYIQMYCNYKNGQSEYIPQKTDGADGYTLESDLPEKQAAGEYTLKYEYAGWTNEVVVRINKRIIACPYVVVDEETQLPKEYIYTGSPIAPQVVYDTQYSMPVTENIPKVDAGTYSIEFALKDKANTVWSLIDETNNHTSNNISVDWYLSDPDIAAKYDEASNTFTFDYTGEPIACPIIASLVDLDKINILYGASGNVAEWTADPPKDPGRYLVYITLKDEKNYIIKGWDDVDVPNTGDMHMLTTMIID